MLSHCQSPSLQELILVQWVDFIAAHETRAWMETRFQEAAASFQLDIVLMPLVGRDVSVRSNAVTFIVHLFVA